MLQTIGEYARERLEARRETREIALRHAHRYAAIGREIRDGIEGADQIGAVERGIAEEANLQAALDTLLAAARDGDAAACEVGMQLSGDLWMYWHIRGKNITAREYAAAFSARTSRAPDAGARGRADHRRACVLDPRPARAGERGVGRGVSHRSRARTPIASAVLPRLPGRSDCSGSISTSRLEVARERSSTAASAVSSGPRASPRPSTGSSRPSPATSRRHRRGTRAALEIQEQLGDDEGAGVSLGGLAQLAAMRGDLDDSARPLPASLDAFEAIGDRAEEARILSEMAWTLSPSRRRRAARRYFFDSVQAYTDVASVRGVGLSLIGLAAAEAVEQRLENAVQIAAAAEVYAQEEGIVNVYSDETPGREYVDQARAALSADEVARAAEAGRSLSINEALDLARVAAVASPSR